MTDGENTVRSVAEAIANNSTKGWKAEAQAAITAFLSSPVMQRVIETIEYAAEHAHADVVVLQGKLDKAPKTGKYRAEIQDGLDARQNLVECCESALAELRRMKEGEW